MPLTLADLQARGFDADTYIETCRAFIASPNPANAQQHDDDHPQTFLSDEECDNDEDLSLVFDELHVLGCPVLPPDIYGRAYRAWAATPGPRPIHDPYATPPIVVPPVEPTDVLRGPTVTSPIIDEVTLPGDTDSRPMYSPRPEPTPIDYQPTLDAAAEAMRHINDSDPCWTVTFGPHRGLRVPFGWAWATLFYGGDVVLNVDGMDYRALHPQAMVAIGVEEEPRHALDRIVSHGLNGTAQRVVPPRAAPPEENYDDPPEDEDDEEEEVERWYLHRFDGSVSFTVRSRSDDPGDITRDERYDAFIEAVNDMGTWDLDANHYDTEEE